GLQLILDCGSQTPLPMVPDRLNMVHGYDGENLHVGVFDVDGPETIPSGVSSIMKVKGRVDVVEAVVSDLSHQTWSPEVTTAKSSGLPSEHSLSQNRPNPFNPSTEISFSLPAAADVTLKVYNITGRLVTTLVDGRLEAGRHTVTWDGSDAASGVYFYRFQAAEFVASRKMILLK
ncbi:MAG: T9SS type A sorting domain-containing protein, partial [Candidatus Zixiibacteriota bacterium]